MFPTTHMIFASRKMHYVWSFYILLSLSITNSSSDKWWYAAIDYNSKQYGFRKIDNHFSLTQHKSILLPTLINKHDAEEILGKIRHRSTAQRYPKQTEFLGDYVTLNEFQAFSYPNITGMPFGGPNYFPYVMVEIHYNNAQLKKGHVDNSGIRFYFTDKLREYDAGILETGLEYTNRMAIPPGQNMFPLSGYCMTECTDRTFPYDGITIFGSQLHSHLTGREIETIVFHEGRGWEYLNADRHYSPHWQEIRLIKPITVYPGDTLITTCRYVTSKKMNVTFTDGKILPDEAANNCYANMSFNGLFCGKCME